MNRFLNSLLATKISSKNLSLFRITFFSVLLAEVIRLNYFKVLIFDKIPYLSPAEIDFSVPIVIWAFSVIALILGVFTRFFSILNYLLSLILVGTIHTFEYHVFYSYIGINFIMIFMPISKCLSVDRLIEKLKFVTDSKFERITYTEAIAILLDSPAYKKKKFKYDVSWGIDMQSEHERYLVEKHFKKPVIVTGYPAAIKAFYMRLNDGCEPGKQTVAAMDILAPGIGEIVGGSQREERLDKLVARMEEMHIPTQEMSWYLDTRRFGTVPHAGFGLGFERMVQFVTVFRAVIRYSPTVKPGKIPVGLEEKGVPTKLPETGINEYSKSLDGIVVGVTET